MEDSFAERMRKRALERLERNAHLIEQVDDDLGCPSLCKKLKSPLLNERENKENIKDNTAPVSSIPTTKPVIAEHLTVRKSLITDSVNCDEPGAFVMRNIRKPSLFAEEEQTVEVKREDVYVKQCKNRLANLAGKYKNFEDELPLHPTPQKKQPLKRKSPPKSIMTTPEKTKFREKIQNFRESPTRTPEKARLFENVVQSPSRTPEKTKFREKIQNFRESPTRTPEKAKLFENVVQSPSRTPEKTKFREKIQNFRESPTRTPEKAKLLENVVQSPSRTPEKTKLHDNVVQSLECQGFKRVNDTRLLFDFKENVDVNPVPKPKRQFEVAPKEPEKQQRQFAVARKEFEKSKPECNGVSNLYSNAKFQNNIFVQNSLKEATAVTNTEPDPSLLSVAERRKLFEMRMRGELDEKSDERTTPMPSKTTRDEDIPAYQDEDAEFNSGNEYSTCESDNNAESEQNRSRTPTSEEDFNSGREDDHPAEKEADISQYPMLGSVKKVKFMSTPKPGRLYPSVSDLDGEVEEDPNTSKPETSYKSPETNYKSPVTNDSFGQEVLCATNSIFSSFHNSRKEISSIEKSKQDLLNEVRDLISPNNETMLSLSPVARYSLASVECPNETASFTYMRPGASNSIDESPRARPKMVEAQSGVDGEDENEIKTEENPDTDVNQKIRYLEELIVKEKIRMGQGVRALKLCLSTSFVNSASHLATEKLLLLSQLKIDEAQNEIQRIKVEKSVRPYSSSSNSVRGNVVISNIRLPVKMSVVHSNLKDDIENNLICVVKCGEMVLATEVMPVVQSKIKQDVECTYIEFPDTITVPDVTSDFKIRVEVYNLVVERKDQSYVKNKEKDKKNLNASKKSKKAKLFSTAYNNREDKKNSHSFQMVGHMIFSQSLAQRHQWMLNKHHSPLVGMILMELKCNLAQITVHKHGFLTMYEIISGYGAWSRYWFYLNGDMLSFWKYPEQESVQDPIGIFDLKKCITKDVVVVGYDIVFRPQTFILKFDPPTYLKQFKNLSEDRLLLSADTEDERISWCECLNEVLKSVRSWSSPSE